MVGRFTARSAEETLALGASLGQSLKEGDIVALTGELGAGKTVFAKGIAKGLGITDEVVSPTFTLQKSYPGRLALHHFDLYRIGDEEELYHIGFYDALGEGVCVIEWAERALSLPPCIRVALCGAGAQARTIEIEDIRP
jgi:tRNA threonylcarbamoyladenosine biosynthesis protein TsaE